MLPGWVSRLSTSSGEGPGNGGGGRSGSRCIETLLAKESFLCDDAGMDDLDGHDRERDAGGGSPTGGVDPGAVPRRTVRDPRELRALAHPLRLALLEELAAQGEATATELADRVGESPANCSWHLRQLARFGFIEEGEPRSGRARPWRWVAEVQEFAEVAEDAPELRVVRDATVAVMFERDMEAHRAWQAEQDQAPEPWQRASFSARGMNWLTAEELAAMNADIEQVVERHLIARLDRVDPEHRPTGSHLVRFLAWGFPAGRPSELDAQVEPADGDAARQGEERS